MVEGNNKLPKVVLSSPYVYIGGGGGGERLRLLNNKAWVDFGVLCAQLIQGT